MLNFANLFNNFRNANISGVSQMLDTPGITLKKLLDEESFVTEYKSQNQKIIDFLKYPKVSELLDYVVQVGPPDDKRLSYKFPLAASQILSTDNQVMVEFFFPSAPLTVAEIFVEEFLVDVQYEVDQDMEENSNEDSNQDSSNSQSKKATEEEKTEKMVPEKTIIKDTLEILPGAQIMEVEEASPLVAAPAEEEEVLSKETSPEKRKKKIIRQELKKVEKNVITFVEPLIGKLMSYFDGNINYTLVGYVCKILTTFCNKRPAEVLKYLLLSENTARIVKHAESRSVGDLFLRILTFENTICISERIELVALLQKELSVDSQIHILSNLSAYMVELIQRIALNQKNINSKVVEHIEIFNSIDVQILIRNVMSENENVSVYNSPVLYAYLANSSLSPVDEKSFERIKSLLSLFIDKSIEKLTVDSKKRPKLGIGRAKLVQIIRFLLKDNVLKSRKVVSQKEAFFPTLLNLLQQYQMNNLLHNQIMKIIDLALSAEESDPLNASLLKDNLLMNFITTEVQADRQIKAGTSTSKFRKGFIAHVIQLCVRVKQLQNSGNSRVKELAESKQFQEVCEGFIEKELVLNRRNLAGFALRREVRQQVLFSKEDILNLHASFLTKCPLAVYENVPDNQTNFAEELSKNLEDNIVFVTHSNGIVDVKDSEEEEKLKEFKAFNKSLLYTDEKYLVYDIDHLLDELNL